MMIVSPLILSFSLAIWNRGDTYESNLQVKANLEFAFTHNILLLNTLLCRWRQWRQKRNPWRERHFELSKSKNPLFILSSPNKRNKSNMRITCSRGDRFTSKGVGFLSRVDRFTSRGVGFLSHTIESQATVMLQVTANRIPSYYEPYSKLLWTVFQVTTNRIPSYYESHSRLLQVIA